MGNTFLTKDGEWVEEGKHYVLWYVPGLSQEIRSLFGVITSEGEYKIQDGLVPRWLNPGEYYFHRFQVIQNEAIKELNKLNMTIVLRPSEPQDTPPLCPICLARHAPGKNTLCCL